MNDEMKAFIIVFGFLLLISVFAVIVLGLKSKPKEPCKICNEKSATRLETCVRVFVERGELSGSSKKTNHQ